MALSGLSMVSRPSAVTPLASEWIFATCKRQHSTFRRTRKALKVKPDPSFLPSKTEAQDHIIFNPPSSIPNVYHTPSKFLPPDDPRRNIPALESAANRGAPKPDASISARQAQLPPGLHDAPVKPYNVTPEQANEIRKLRAEDPLYWTRPRLAKKFQCSAFFIELCAKSRSDGGKQQAALEAIKAKWGRAKTEAREVAKERKKLWGRD